MRWLVAALVLTVLGLGIGQAAGFSVSAGTVASGSGNVVAPPAQVTKVKFYPDTGDIALLDYVDVTMDKTPPGGLPLLHIDLYVQLRGAAGVLGSPKVVHDFGGGLDGAAKTDSVSFYGEGVPIAQISYIDFTVCGRHEPGDGDFQCRLPP